MGSGKAAQKRNVNGPWHAFIFPHGSYALHRASSTLVEIPEQWAETIKGGTEHLPKEILDIEKKLRCRPDPANRFKSKTTRQRTQLIHEKIHNEGTPLTSIALHLTEACNLACTYCYLSRCQPGSGVMTFETARRAITFFGRKSSDLDITFFGGEPMLRYELVQKIVEDCERRKRKRFRFSMTTNAFLMTHDALRFFVNHRFRLTISCDGRGLQKVQRPDRAGRQTEDRIFQVLREFKTDLSKLPSVILRMTVMRQHLDRLDRAISSLLSETPFDIAVSIHTVHDRGAVFRAKDVDEFAAVMGRIVHRLMAAHRYEALLRMVHLRHALKVIHDGCVGISWCAAGIRSCSVLTDGTIALCHRFDGINQAVLGHLTRGLKRKFLARITSFRRNSLPRGCQTCWVKEWCAGGCFYENQTGTSIFTPRPQFCRLQRELFTQAVFVYTRLQQVAPRFLERL